MRKSSNNKSRTEPQDTRASCSCSCRIDLDRLGLSEKNRELTKEVVKLKAETAELRSEIMYLQNQLFHFQRKEAELKQNIKSQAPHFALMVTWLMEYCDSDATAVNRISLPKVSTRENNSTQRVGPHMVNGVVLNVSPKVSLTRMDPICSGERSPSTSTNSFEPADSESANLSTAISDSSERNVRADELISRRSRSNQLETSLDDEGQNMSLENRENEAPNQSATFSSPALRANLSTISEGSEHSESNRYDGMRITLTRMSIEEMRRNTFRSVDSSMEAMASESCLSFEATVIQHQDFQDSRESKGSKNMTFSPCLKSSRVVDQNSTEQGMQSIEPARTNQSQTSQMDSVMADCSSGSQVTHTLACLPTPSMSALGDIEENYSRLEIVFDSRMTSTPTIAKSNTHEHSTPLSSQRKRKSAQGGTKLVNSKSERRRIPVVVLEKMSHCGDNTQTELKENNSLDTMSKSRSKSNASDKATKTKSKSMKKSVKRKLAEDEDETETQVVSECDRPPSGRPQRSAKPTALKEMSLKHKMRRT